MLIHHVFFDRMTEQLNSCILKRAVQDIAAVPYAMTNPATNRLIDFASSHTMVIEQVYTLSDNNAAAQSLCSLIVHRTKWDKCTFLRHLEDTLELWRSSKDLTKLHLYRMFIVLKSPARLRFKQLSAGWLHIFLPCS